MISSLVVECGADSADAVARSLEALRGVEVHERVDERLVITIEADTVEAGYAVAASLIAIEGVTGVQLVYANFEE